MSTSRLNPQSQLKVDNISGYGGNISSTFGVKLYANNGPEGRRGEIGFGGKMYPHSINTDSGLSTIGTIQSFIYTNADGSNKYWAADSNKLYKQASPVTTRFAADALASTPTSVNGDLVVFGRPSGSDVLIVPTSTDLWKLTGGAWTANFWTTTLGQAALSSSNVHANLFFPSPFLLLVVDGNAVHSIDQANVVTANRLLLPANHTIIWSRYANGFAYFGVTTTDKSSGGVWQYDPVNESATFASFDIAGGASSAPFIVHNRLYVVAPDGRLKEFDGTGFTNWQETPASKANTNLIVHRNGVAVVGTRVRILTEGISGTYPAGVLTYDFVDNNLYHELPITCGVGDAGQQSVSDIGALWSDGQFTFGGINGATVGIFMDSDRFSASSADRNYVTFPRLNTGNIKDGFSKVWVKHALFGTDTYLVKYKNKEYSGGFPPGGNGLTGTWTSTTVFTTSASLTDSASMVGFEAMIMSGTNAGLTAHITSITLNAGVYTVTLDEAIGLGSGTSTISIRPWKKCAPRTNPGSTNQSADFALPNESAEWEQVKIEMRGELSFIKDVFFVSESNEAPN